MTKDEVTKLNPGDRVVDVRDGVGAVVIMVNDETLRVRYDDSSSSNYIATQGCQHLLSATAQETFNAD